MIDIHTHILPEMDDGSRSVEETQKMFEMLLEQGVDTVVATPHLYLDEIGIDTFLSRRSESLKKLNENISLEKRPRLALGAEVQFVPELHAMENVEKLCISGSKYLLVEMPFLEWSGYTYRYLNNLYTMRGITPIVAHVERYLDFQKDDEVVVLRKLREANALIQINSSFLIEKATRRKALSLIKKNLVNFMGSDAHNMEIRKPEIIGAYDVVYNKLGDKGIDLFEFWEEKFKERIETI